MGKRKKPEGETFEEAKIRHCFEQVANKATRSEKMSWDRRMDNMVELMSSLKPIEEKILDLMSEKNPIIKQVQELRTEMIVGCIHPYEYLVFKGTHLECKFCFKKISLPK